jgi:hypothetical protein
MEHTVFQWRLLNPVTSVIVYRDLYICVFQSSNT